MADSKYRILVQAVIDPAQLQKELDKTKATKIVKVPAEIQIKNLEKVENQIKRWQNALAKMEARTPKAFAREEVQEQVAIFNRMIDGYRAGKIPIDNLRTQLDNVRTSLTQVSSEMRFVNKDGMAMSQMFELAVKKVAIWAGATTVIYGTLRQIREGTQYIRDLDKELTDLALVSGMNAAQVGAMAQQYNELAMSLGATTLQVAQSALTWARQGKSVEESNHLIRNGMIISKLAAIESAQASEYLTSMMMGYKMSVEETTAAIDKMIAVDNASATSVAELAEALSRTSSVAQIAGVAFEELVAYIGTTSSVTRRSAESVGEAYKTIFTRMQNIKLGKLFEDEATTINDVEKALSRVQIPLRENEVTFRNMSDVLRDVAEKWHTFDDTTRASITQALAGTRQANMLIALLDNWSLSQELLQEEMESTGLTAQRFGIYLDSLEAKTNRFTAAWEKMIASTIDSEAVKSMIDLGTMLLDIADNFGVLNMAILALTTVLSLKMGLTIPTIIKGIMGLRTALVGLTITAEATSAAMATLSAMLGGLAIGGAILVAIHLYNQLNTSMKEVYDNFEKSRAQSEANRNELMSLADEYEALANKQDRTLQENTRLLDIQTIINTKYAEARGQLDLYTAAVQNNTEAIRSNAQALREQAEQEIRNFLERNKLAMEEAKRILSEKRERVTGMEWKKTEFDLLTAVPQYGLLTAKEYLRVLEERIVKEGDVTGELRKQYDELSKEVAAAEDLIIAYEKQENLLKEITLSKLPQVEIPEMLGPGLSDAIETAKNNMEALKAQFKDLSMFMEDDLGKAFERFNDEQRKAGQKAETLRLTIEELERQDMLTDEQMEKLQELQDELKSVEDGINKTADAYEKSTRIALINLMIQRIEVMNLGETEAAVAFQMINDLAYAWGLVTTQTYEATQQIDKAFLALAEGNIKLAQEEILKVGAFAQAVSGDYLIRFFVEVITGKSNLDPSEMGMALWQDEILNRSANVIAAIQAIKDAINAASGFLGTRAGGRGATREEEEARESINALYQLIIDWIRQQKQEEIELIEIQQQGFEDQIDAIEKEKDLLDEQLDQYKEIIDARKEVLDSYEEELDYQDRIRDKNASIAKLQFELAVLARDDSLESKARQLELQEELTGELADLEDMQRKRSFDLQKEALDDEYKLYQDRYETRVAILDAEKEALEHQIELLEEQIDLINKYLSSPGLISQEAIAILETQAPELYQNLIEWNAIYGSGIDEDVTRAWNEAYEALARYASLIDALRGESEYDYPPLFPQFHSGIKAGPVAGIWSPSSEVLAKLIPGEIVLKDRDILGILSSISAITGYVQTKASEGGLMINNLINVEGNLDEKVLPDLKRIANEVVNVLITNLNNRGITRGAQLFSI